LLLLFHKPFAQVVELFLGEGGLRSHGTGTVTPPDATDKHGPDVVRQYIGAASRPYAPGGTRVRDLDASGM
jgi:hypothetical protein